MVPWYCGTKGRESLAVFGVWRTLPLRVILAPLQLDGESLLQHSVPAAASTAFILQGQHKGHTGDEST